jgi:hypothetical protein
LSNPDVIMLVLVSGIDGASILTGLASIDLGVKVNVFLGIVFIVVVVVVWLAWLTWLVWLLISTFTPSAW